MQEGKFYRVVGINTDSITDYLSICGGVTTPDQACGLESSIVDEYDQGAMVPDGNWTALNSDETSEFTVSQESVGQASLALIKLTRFEKTFVSRFSRKFRGPELTPKIMEDIKRVISSYVSVKSGFEVLGVFESNENLYTVTRNKKKKLLGLHIDNWDGSELVDRSAARQRICFNLGPGSRYFLYSPYRVLEEVFNSHKTSEYHLSRATIETRKFLYAKRTTPIIRVCLAPGFAYLAPTESIVHDGSTINISSPSATLVCFGHFSLRRYRGTGAFS